MCEPSRSFSTLKNIGKNHSILEYSPKQLFFPGCGACDTGSEPPGILVKQWDLKLQGQGVDAQWMNLERFAKWIQFNATDSCWYFNLRTVCGRNFHCLFIPCLLGMIFTRACSYSVSERGTAQNWDGYPKANDWKTPNSPKFMSLILQVFLLWTPSPSLLGIQDNYEFGDISRSLLRILAGRVEISYHPRFIVQQAEAQQF